jgi:hypothetical protein
MTDQNIVAVNQIVRRVEVTTPGPAGRDGVGGGGSLADLSDTVILNPVDKNLLVYEDSSSKWKNVAADTSYISGLGTAAVKDTGTSQSSVIIGNDTRLSDARTPTTTLDHDADKVTTGIFGVDRIPALAASKITSGTLGVDRIPAISTGKLTSGTLPVGRGGTGLTSVSTLLNSNTTKSDVGLSAVENTALTTWAGSGSITTVGAITGGTWDGTTIAVARGGTGSATAAMVGVITAADAAAAQGVLGGTTVGKAVFVAADAAAARTAIGVGTGSGDLVASNNLSELTATAATARTNLGLGTAALVATGTGAADAILGNDARLTDARTPSSTLDHDASKITTGTLVVARGGTGLTSISTLLNSNTTKSDVGLGNVTNIEAQPVNADLTAIAGLTSAANKGIQFTGSGTAAVYTLTTAGKALLDDADAATQRQTLGLGTAAVLAVGTNNLNVVQLSGVGALPAVSGSALTGLNAGNFTSGTLAVARGGTGLTSISTLLNSNTTKSDVGLGNVTNIVAQPADADLTAIAGLTSAADKGIQFTGAGTAGVYDLTAAGKALLDDADAAAQRTTLGVTNVGSYTGQIETVANKTYTLDPGTATARTITGFYIKSASGTVTATLKNGASDVDAAPVTPTSANRNPGGFTNTSVAINGVITIVTSANSTALDVIFAVEYTE